MNIVQIIKTRRSIREYKNTPIPKKILIRLVDAGLAPTARNIQPWEFIVITQKEALQKLAEIITENGRFIAQASCAIAVFSSETKYYLEDGSSATENILLAAASFGIGSCWIAGDKKEYAAKVSDFLNAPVPLKLISLIALGYPSIKNSFKVARRPIADLLHWEKFK